MRVKSSFDMITSRIVSCVDLLNESFIMLRNITYSDLSDLMSSGSSDEEQDSNDEGDGQSQSSSSGNSKSKKKKAKKAFDDVKAVDSHEPWSMEELTDYQEDLLDAKILKAAEMDALMLTRCSFIFVIPVNSLCSVVICINCLLQTKIIIKAFRKTFFIPGSCC